MWLILFEGKEDLESVLLIFKHSELKWSKNRPRQLKKKALVCLGEKHLTTWSEFHISHRKKCFKEVFWIICRMNDIVLRLSLKCVWCSLWRQIFNGRLARWAQRFILSLKIVVLRHSFQTTFDHKGFVEAEDSLHLSRLSRKVCPLSSGPDICYLWLFKDDKMMRIF